MDARMNALKLARETLTQMIACHDEPTCPAIDMAREALSAIGAELAASADAGSQQLPEGWRLDHAQESEPGIVRIGHVNEDGVFYEVVIVDTNNYFQPERAMPIAQAIIAALARPAPATSKIADERTQECTNGAPSARGAPAVVSQSLTTAPVSAQGDEVDAARYRWLSDRFLGADFGWGVTATEAGRQVLVFEWPGGPVWGDLATTVDAARAQQGGQS